MTAVEGPVPRVVVCMMGLPACGKSSISRNLVAAGAGVQHVEFDGALHRALDAAGSFSEGGVCPRSRPRAWATALLNGMP